ncbi:MAG: tryptophan synthase subunit alpha, partial [Chloroflexi bacterium]|nr:tryptophan synthase subunit alpha [Chloroflexota bacterium]
GSALIQAAGTGLDALTALAVSLHAALRKDG